MIEYHQIKAIHLELTTKCQAACPMCARNIDGGSKINPHLSLTELSLNDIKHIFPESFVQQLKKITFCGNYGDPIIAKDTLDIISYIKKCNSNINLILVTNGGARDQDWWETLVFLLNKKGSIIFSVDGLKDTNHLYRQNVSWTNVERAMKTVASLYPEGCLWEFLVFEHNEHQIEQAQQLADKLNIKILFKKTSRFVKRTQGIKLTQWEVKNTKGEIVNYLREPKNELYRNKSLQNENIIKNLYENPHLFKKIICKAQVEKELYISAEGLVLPCCWWGAYMYGLGYDWKTMHYKDNEIWNHLPENLDEINLKKHDLKTILKTPTFQDLPRKWKISTIQEGRPWACESVCGIQTNLYNDQRR